MNETDYTNWDSEQFLGGWKPSGHYQRRVVCAANRYGDGPDALVVCSARHNDHRMNNTLSHLKEDKLFDFEEAGRATQGFIDQFGVFMDRTEAWHVAVAANQICDRCPPERWGEETLYSEWLY